MHSRRGTRPLHRKHWSASASSIATHTQHPCRADKVSSRVRHGCASKLWLGWGTSMTIALKDMIAELRRELRHRRTVYPSMVKRGALTEASADRQNARLRRHWTCWSASRTRRSYDRRPKSAFR